MSGYTEGTMYLPGNVLPFKNTNKICCDNANCDELATVCVVGETDSFGSELIHLCNAHFQQERMMKFGEDTLKFCEICNGMKKNVERRRDPAEGSAGRVYDMCPDCYKNIIDDFVGEPDEVFGDEEPF